MPSIRVRLAAISGRLPAADSSLSHEDVDGIAALVREHQAGIGWP
jgi:hypothetical protein